MERRRCADCPAFLSIYNPGARCALCEAAAQRATTPPPWTMRTSHTPRGFTLEPYLANKTSDRQGARRAETRRQARATVDLPSTKGCAHAG